MSYRTTTCMEGGRKGGGGRGPEGGKMGGEVDMGGTCAKGRRCQQSIIIQASPANVSLFR